MAAWLPLAAGRLGALRPAVDSVAALGDSLPPLLRKAVLLYAYAALTVLWAVLLVRRLRPGLARLLAAAPVLAGNFLVPLLLDPEGPLSEPLLITPLLAFALARGPLMPEWLSPLQFGGVYLLPIVPIEVFTVGPQHAARVHTTKHGRQLLLDAWASTGVAMLVSWVLAIPGIPVMVRHWLYTLASATFLCGVFDLLGAFAHMTLGITAAPTFDRPWLSASFQDFWSRRWNLTTTYMMRALVYEPVLQGSLLAPGSATLAAQLRAAATEPRTAAADGGQDLAPAGAAVEKTDGDSNLRLRRKGAEGANTEEQVFTANFLLIAVAKPLFFGPADTTGFAQRNLAVGQAPLWAVADVAKRAGHAVRAT
ncbi:hypothetical protein HYH03_001289 [Edaphochlamys debaryana]|uniref:Uncharacterized protein n=1 Tax=Edaphochlamys debaryana TaxID=47281 RepID=A0A835YF16_9CHLO|nr:hypothetical protein HYH03_001289 [Edaphochlamys debaryana]|eukprot:KAG2500512.1 hypothetical protein HYH03_001289 [Edaphochlamys debaryana]